MQVSRRIHVHAFINQLLALAQLLTFQHCILREKSIIFTPTAQIVYPLTGDMNIYKKVMPIESFNSQQRALILPIAVISPVCLVGRSQHSGTRL